MTYKIIITNTIQRLSEEELKDNPYIIFEAPVDEKDISEDIWSKILESFLKLDCYYFSTFGLHSEKLHDMIDDLAFDLFPFLHNKNLSYESDFEEITHSWDILAGRLITIWFNEPDGDDIDNLLNNLYFRYQEIDGKYHSIIFLKDLVNPSDSEYLFKYSCQDLNELKPMLMRSSGLFLADIGMNIE